jgi:diguanylate cyclase (GGDEF)-like protein/PAS domain S-box-containing protein
MPLMPPPARSTLLLRLFAFVFDRQRSIRWHIVVLFSLATAGVLILVGGSIQIFVSQAMRDNMMEKLADSTYAVKEVIENAAHLGIRNHLQTIAHTNVDTLVALENQVRAGKLTREAAQQVAAEIFLAQRIGDEGYVYVVNSQGIVQVHPQASLAQADLSQEPFIRRQVAQQNGLLDYAWKNPGERSARSKTLAMAHFAPWDWIVSVTCYENEFKFLARELRQGLKNHHFGRTGYAFIVSGKGDIILHPLLQGNVHTLDNAAALSVFNAIAARKNGHFDYLWQDAPDRPKRRKIVFFHTIAELDWIVASAVYEEEIFAPLDRLGWIITAIVLGALFLVVLPGLYLGNLIARPLARLAMQMERAVDGDLDVRAEEDGLGEIGRLGRHFNGYIERLRNSNRELVAEINERSSAQQQLLIYRNAVEQALEGIIITDVEGNILAVNQAFTEITQYGADEVRHRNVRLLQSGRHDRVFYQTMWQVLTQSGRWSGEIWNRRKNGEVYPQILGISAIVDQQGQATHYVGLFHDITELKLKEEHIVHQAYHDSLTGLPNRRLAMDRIEVSIAHVRRGGTKLAVLILDLDNFKNINDSLGHANGDILLLQVTNRLVAQVRAEDTVARLGGDEFLLLVAAITSEEVVIDMIQRLLKSLTPPFQVDGQEFFVTASIGVAFFPNDGANAGTLIQHADIAMYQAKALGKNSYCLFTSALSERISFLRRLENNLRQAVNNREFVVYFQPKFDPFAATIVGAEALVRWQRDDGTLVNPADFIPLAEETGLIIPLGEQVLEQTCQVLATLKSRGWNHLALSVNLSPLQFGQANLVERLLAILRHHGVASQQLELEITETAMMSNLANTVEALGELVANGLSIAIDDFGTGYSSLSYLKRFPIRTLKIDRSFIRDLTQNPSDAQLVETIILMAHNLGITVVAEGVETEAQLEWLKSRGCEQIQGYLYSRPLPVDDFLDFVEQCLMPGCVDGMTTPLSGCAHTQPEAGFRLPRISKQKEDT